MTDPCCGLSVIFCGFISHLIGRETINIPEIFSGVHGFTGKTVTPARYFNARLLHYSGRFAMNLEYLFFVQFILEQKKVSDGINIALKKLQGQP